MKDITAGYRQDFTYRPTQNWIDKPESEQREAIQEVLASDPSYDGITVRQVQKNGHVVLRIEHSIAASERGLFLLDLEQRLKDRVDIGITLWLEPVGDKSKLRQLRGVDVKS